MKKIYLMSIIVCLLFPAAIFAQGVWTQKADYLNGTRFDFVGYASNNKGYIGAGRHSWYNSYLADWMEFDPVLNTWVQKAPLPMPTSGATAFNAANKGYVTTGANDRTYIYDIYESDSLANNWYSKAFAYIPRQRATGVGVGNMGYVIGGYNVMGGSMNDCWEYNQPLDTWTEKASLPLLASRYYATGFSLNGKVYVFGGTAGISILNDLWEFDPTNNIWTEKASLPGMGRRQAISFVINNEAYVIGGYNYFGYLKECWKYNANSDQWTKLDDFPGLRGPAGGVGFTINGLGYIVCGNGTSECWEFDPQILKSASLLSSNGAATDKMKSSVLNVFPNPATTKVYVNIPEGIVGKSVTIYTISGEIVQQDIQMLNPGDAIDISKFQPGVYFVTVQTSEGTKLNAKFVKTNR